VSSIPETTASTDTTETDRARAIAMHPASGRAQAMLAHPSSPRTRRESHVHVDAEKAHRVR